MRRFGAISTTIWRSSKFRRISTDLGKLVYFFLHTAPGGTSAGIFIQPAELTAFEMRQDAEQVRAAYLELCDLELLRYDPDEEIVQIRNFYLLNLPGSRKALAGPLTILSQLPKSPVLDCARCDLVVAIHERAKTWQRDVEARGVFYQEAANLIKTHDLATLLCSTEINLEEQTLIALSEALLIDLPIGVPIQGPRPRQDHGHDIDHYRDTDQNRDTDRRGGARVAAVSAASAPPSPPADGGQSGLKDIQEAIADLNARQRKGKHG